MVLASKKQVILIILLLLFVPINNAWASNLNINADAAESMGGSQLWLSAGEQLYSFIKKKPDRKIFSKLIYFLK